MFLANFHSTFENCHYDDLRQKWNEYTVIFEVVIQVWPIRYRPFRLPAPHKPHRAARPGIR